MALSKFELDGKKRGPFPNLHDVARVMLDQGMRPDEVMSLRVEHVDFENGKLRIINGKSRAARRILSMSEEVKAILAVRAKGRSMGWLFEGKKAGTRLTKLNNSHDAVLKKIGASFVLYEFRHTFATRYGETVGDPIALAAILGHADLKTVMKYCHVRESHTAEQMKQYHRQQAEQARAASSVN